MPHVGALDIANRAVDRGTVDWRTATSSLRTVTLLLGERRIEQILSQICYFIVKLPVARRIEPTRSNKAVEIRHTFLTRSPAPARQADPDLPFILRVALTCQITRAFHSLEQRS